MSEPSSSGQTLDDDDEVWTELAHLRADASPITVVSFTHWSAKVISEDKERLNPALIAFRARWPEATTEQLARALFDGTQPKVTRRPSCPTCCDEFDTADEFADHLETCGDPDFIPADAIAAAGSDPGVTVR